jgi:hypothetical protein
VSSGATVSVYVTAPLCAGAKQELGRSGGRAGEVRVRAVCLRAGDRSGESALVVIGAGARRAVEDSTTVGYIGEPEPLATRFSRPILTAAEIARVANRSGAVAMAGLLRAIRDAGGASDLRKAVNDRL